MVCAAGINWADIRPELIGRVFNDRSAYFRARPRLLDDDMADADEPAAELTLRVPRHAMGMMIGKHGAGFRDIEAIPELRSCKLEQPNSGSGGILRAEGSLRAVVAVADRVKQIIDLSFERNVRRPTYRSEWRPERYERPKSYRSDYGPPGKRRCAARTAEDSSAHPRPADDLSDDAVADFDDSVR